MEGGAVLGLNLIHTLFVHDGFFQGHRIIARFIEGFHLLPSLGADPAGWGGACPGWFVAGEWPEKQ